MICPPTAPPKVMTVAIEHRLALLGTSWVGLSLSVPGALPATPVFSTAVAPLECRPALSVSRSLKIPVTGNLARVHSGVAVGQVGARRDYPTSCD